MLFTMFIMLILMMSVILTLTSNGIYNLNVPEYFNNGRSKVGIEVAFLSNEHRNRFMH